MSRLRSLATRPRVMLPAAVLVVAAAGAGTWAATRPSAAAGPAYRLVAAATTTLRQAVSSTGTLAPATTATLGFSASGRVTAVDVTVGQRVRKNQRLATLDSAALQAQVAQANAELAGAKARLASDQSSGASSAQLAADQASVDAAQSGVDSATAALDGATLTSPIDGTVAGVGLTVGQQISGGSSQSGSQGGNNAGNNNSTIVVISDDFVVDAGVDATVVGQIKTGDQAVITTDGASGPVYGTVSSVGLTATTSSGVATFPVVVAVTGTPKGLYAGAPATVAIIYRQLTDVLAVPAAAVHTAGGRSTVTVLVGGHQVAKTVSTGLTSGGQTQITAGLAAGDQVVVAVPRLANPGGTSNRGGTNRGNRGTFGGGGGFRGGGFGGPPGDAPGGAGG